MTHFWDKLNVLVPAPQCRTKGSAIIEWTDSRQQPTQTEIDSVTTEQVQAQELLDAKGKIVALDPCICAAIEVLYATGVFSGSYSTLEDLKSAIIQKQKDNV